MGTSPETGPGWLECRAPTSSSPSWGDQAGNPRSAVSAAPSGPGRCLCGLGRTQGGSDGIGASPTLRPPNHG